MDKEGPGRSRQSRSRQWLFEACRLQVIVDRFADSVGIGGELGPRKHNKQPVYESMQV